MKITFVSRSLSRVGGGVVSAMSSLARHLRARGAEIEVRGFRDEATQLDMEMWRGCKAIAMTKVGFVGRALGASIMAGQGRIDVIHSHGLWTAASVLPAMSGLLGAHVVASPHGMLDPWALRQGATKKRFALGTYERIHLSRASCIHALTHHEADQIHQLGFRTPVCVIPNGVDIPTDDFGVAANRRSRPSGRRCTLLFLGRVHPKKGLDFLMRIMQELGKEEAGHRLLMRWQLIVAGPDELGTIGALKEICRTLHLDGTVSFVGPVYGLDKRTLLRDADAFVLPSLSEGLPMAVLEAWACGVPVLMTDACNLEVGFQAGAAMRLPTDLRSAAVALAAFLDLSDAQRRQMGERGAALVNEIYTWESVADKFLEVYGWISGLREKPGFVV